jgi:MFS family permease
MVGLLNSLPSLLLVLSAVPAGRYVARQTSLKRVVVRSSIVFRLSYLLIALVPWFAPTWAGAAIVAIWALAAIPTNLVEVSVTAALAEAVPPTRRAQVISTRFAIHSCVAALALPGIGRLLDTLPFPVGYQVVFVGSFLAAMASTWAFSRVSIPDQVVPRVQRQVPSAARIRAAVAEVGRHRAFALYLVSITVFRLGLTMPRPLWSIFWVNDLHLSDSQIGLATTVVYVFSIVGYFLWGRVASRRGHAPVLVAATVGLGMYPLVMGLAQGLPAVLLASCFGGMFTSAYTLATFNVLLALAPPEQRPSYAALNAVSLNSMALFGPLLGSVLAESLGIRIAMILGAAVRFLGGALFVLRPVSEEPPPPR